MGASAQESNRHTRRSRRDLEHFGKTGGALPAWLARFCGAPAGNRFRRTVDELGNASGCRRHPAICAGERRGARAINVFHGNRCATPVHQDAGKTLHRRRSSCPGVCAAATAREMANECSSQPARHATQTEKLGYRFLHPDLAGALAAVLAWHSAVDWKCGRMGRRSLALQRNF